MPAKKYEHSHSVGRTAARAETDMRGRLTDFGGTESPRRSLRSFHRLTPNGASPVVQLDLLLHSSSSPSFLHPGSLLEECLHAA